MTADATPRLQRTSREPEQLRQRLERWLSGVLGAAAQPQVHDLQSTDTNGMSSDTVLFRATWSDDDGGRDEHLVARIAPDPADVPVFPSYDMPGQYAVIQRVSELASAPVPRPRWCESDHTVLGAPFFVMDRVDGLIPPDVLPYPFGGNWLYDAPPQQQRRLQDATVDVVAALHEVPDAPAAFPFLERQDAGDGHLRRHVAHTRAWYAMVARDGARSPLVERGFEWLDVHWPRHEGEPVLSWGDARIGNIIYREFTPVALLDWEMAGLGPRELDVAWLVFAHMVFQELATSLGLDGMPEFLRADDVCARYESLTGHTPRDLDFYLHYAAVQWGIVFLRTGQRQAHFGEREMPADREDLIHNRAQLERMFAG